jgi:glycosyltransferase involved in cell wall biosynthesis
VTVITCVPNHPRGKVYPGYSNKLRQWDEIDGIKVLRVKTYLSPNEGFIKRTTNYVSYMLSAALLSPLVGHVDVVISTSPQFFCGMAGLWVSGLKRKPWILEIRDLWPESIVTVGAIKNRSLIRALEMMEAFLYRKADHIVSVTNSFKSHIMKRGVGAERISVITNGADFEKFVPLPKENSIRQEYKLDGKFVVSYIGTHGMAHSLDTVLKAADCIRDEKNIVFLLVGDGAERERLMMQKEQMQLDNVLMLAQQPKEKMPLFLAASDASMVLLKRDDLFKTVIPSKMFEAMAMERPLILGVEGESRQIVEDAQCGVGIEPENFRELAETVRKLSHDSSLVQRLGSNGRRHVEEHYNRDVLASQYLTIIENVRKG